MENKFGPHVGNHRRGIRHEQRGEGHAVCLSQLHAVSGDVDRQPVLPGRQLAPRHAEAERNVGANVVVRRRQNCRRHEAAKRCQKL
jgi:hypothetical protein